MLLQLKITQNKINLIIIKFPQEALIKRVTAFVNNAAYL